MCQKCFIKGISHFPAYWNFDNFQEELIQKISNKDLQIINLDKYLDDKYTLFDNVYECQFCKTIWFLSYPDNAWRGYWLNESEFKDWKIKEFHFKHNNISNFRKIEIVTLLIFLICILLFNLFLKVISP